MEPQTPALVTTSQANQLVPGATVIYGLHGKCVIRAQENRQVGAEQIPFFKLEPVKSTLSRSTRQEPAIWVPVSSARERGLRLPITAAEAEEVLKLLSNREYYFPVEESWKSMLPKLEQVIRAEGAMGLAKAVSYMHVLKKRLVVPSSEVLRFAETVNKLLLRELSEALGILPRTLEDQLAKSMNKKLLPNN